MPHIGVNYNLFLACLELMVGSIGLKVICFQIKKLHEK